MNAKLAELLDLAADITWSAWLSDHSDMVRVHARSQLLPGNCGLEFSMETASTWQARPATTSLQREEAAFWERFSAPGRDVFGGFDVTTADLVTVLPGETLAIVIDAMRTIAARREAAAFRDTSLARSLRAVVRKYDVGWACPVRVAAGQFEDAGHRVRVERMPQPDDGWRPPGCWVIREVDSYVRNWVLPGWWAGRRAADDEARRVLASKDARCTEER